MKFIGIFLASFLLVEILHADVIQVPENCAGKVHPCLIRTKSSVYKFENNGVTVSLMQDSIVKVEKTENQIDFNILKGRIQLNTSTDFELPIYINLVLLDSRSVMAEKKIDELNIFSLERFTLAAHKLENGNLPKRITENFLSKGELVDFVKNYFSNVSDLKKFLVGIEKNWLVEFKRQNENQTKALLRSIASEERQAEERIQRQMREEAERKRVKSEFFYRTFQR